MRYLQFSSFVALVALSCNAYGMIPEQEFSGAKTPTRQIEFSSELFPGEVITALLQMNVLPKTILIDGTVYTPDEYFTTVGANDGNSSIGRDYKVALEKIIRENFTEDDNGIYSPKVRRGVLLSECLQKYINIFPYDDKLKFLRTLTICQEKALDISFVARALFDNLKIIIGTQKNSYQEKIMGTYINLYYSQLDLLAKSNKLVNFDFDRCINNYYLFFKCSDCNDFHEYTAKYKINTKNQADGRMAVRRCLFEALVSILVPLSKYEDPLVFDAFLLSLISGVNFQPHLQPFSAHLYGNFQEKKIPVPPSLQLLYSEYHLYPRKKYDEAIQIYESILDKELAEDNIYQRAYNYHTLFKMLRDAGKVEEALSPLKMAVILESHPNLEFDLACLNLSLGKDVDESLNIMEQIVKMSSEDMRACRMTPSAIKQTYQAYLQKAGRIEEVTKLLLEKQAKSLEKALERSRRQAAVVKAALEHKKQHAQQRQLQIMSSVPPKKTNKTNTEVSTSTTSTLPSQMSSFFGKENDSSTPLKKEKKKRRGEAYKGMTTPVPMQEQLKEPQQTFIHIEQLTDNKNAWKTFYKIFELHQRGNTFDNEVQISLDEMNCFFKALKQNYDPSKGKGSHKKATLNFQGYGIDMEEQMLTLTKSTYLKEYQIKQIREAFINGRIVPDDQNTIEVLKKDYPDLMK